MLEFCAVLAIGGVAWWWWRARRVREERTLFFAAAELRTLGEAAGEAVAHRIDERAEVGDVAA